MLAMQFDKALEVGGCGHTAADGGGRRGVGRGAGQQSAVQLLGAQTEGGSQLGVVSGNAGGRRDGGCTAAAAAQRFRLDDVIMLRVMLLVLVLLLMVVMVVMLQHSIIAG